MTVLHWLLPLRQIVTFLWRLLGILPFFPGLALNLAADRQFKRHVTIVKPSGRPAAMITTGVYRASRNPMYPAFVLIVLGIAVLLGTITPFTVVPILALLMECAFIRVEEPMMEETFGQTWHAYKAKVRRWL